MYGTPGSVTVDTDQVTTRFDVQKIESTPILNRKITAIPLLDSAVRQAQTTGDLFINEVLFVINGEGRRQTTYDLDNTDANDSWGRQTMFAAIPFSAVQEMNVDKNALSAEYGRDAGAAVDVVTKSGSNQWHGDFIGMGRPQFSEAKQPLAAVPAYNTLAQGSGMVSGPIVKDKTFILGAYEYTNQNRDAVITSPVDPGAIYSGTFNQNLLFAAPRPAVQPKQSAHRSRQLRSLHRYQSTGRGQRREPADGGPQVCAIHLPGGADRYCHALAQPGE